MIFNLRVFHSIDWNVIFLIRCAGNIDFSTFAANVVVANLAENSGYPTVYNIEWDPHEEYNLLIENSWVLGPYMKVIQDYQKTLKGHPNPPAPNFTDY